MQYLKRLTPSVAPVQNSVANTIYVDKDTEEVKVGTGASGSAERVLTSMPSGILTITASAVTSTVPYLAPNGTASATSYGFSGAANAGMYWDGGNLNFSHTGTRQLFISSTEAAVNVLKFDINAQDISLSRGAADRLDLATGDSLYLVSGGLGVGVAQTTAGNIRASGSIYADADIGSAVGYLIHGVAAGKLNVTTYDAAAGIGFDFATDGIIKIRNRAQSADAALTASSLTASGNILFSGSDGRLVIGARGFMGAVADGVWKINNDADTGFGRLILGTNDANGVAIQKAGTTIQFVLGNDSGWAPISIGNAVGAAVAVASTHKVTMSVGGVTYYLLATNVA